MSQISLKIVFTTTLVLLGALSCMCDNECTEANILACEFFHNQNECPYYRRSAACLEAIEPNCNEGENLELLRQKKQVFLDNSCPGLEDGICFHNMEWNCAAQTSVPWSLLYSTDEIVELCSAFQGKSQQAKDCYLNVKNGCDTQFIRSSVDERIAQIDQIVALCEDQEQFRNECHFDEIMDCTIWNPSRDCVYTTRSLECLEAIEPKCKGTRYEGFLERRIQGFGDSYCHGYEDGICWYNVARSCHNMFPFPREEGEIGEAQTLQLCSRHHQGKSQEARNCYENIKEACSTHSVQTRIDDLIAQLDQMVTRCEQP